MLGRNAIPNQAQLLHVAVCALAFFALGLVNDWLFGNWVYSHGVNWVFLPSGLRLALVLLFGGWGALGVVLGSLALGLDDSTEMPIVLAASLLSGLSPWLARMICLRALKINADLSNLTYKQLLQMALIFAIISAMLHQALYVGAALSSSFIKGTVIMAAGDLLGAIVVLYAVKLALWLVSRPKA